MGNHSQIESSQVEADRLLAKHQAEGAWHTLPHPPASLFTRHPKAARRVAKLRRALTPWFTGFANPYMDAFAYAALLYFAAILGALFALSCDNQPPRGLAFQASEATSRPVAESSLGGGATREAR